MKNWLRLIASLIVLLVLVYVFRDELDFLREGFSRLSHSNPAAIALVILASIMAVLAMGEVMRLLIRVGGVKVPAAIDSSVEAPRRRASTMRETKKTS